MCTSSHDRTNRDRQSRQQYSKYTLCLSPFPSHTPLNNRRIPCVSAASKINKSHLWHYHSILYVMRAEHSIIEIGNAAVLLRLTTRPPHDFECCSTDLNSVFPLHCTQNQCTTRSIRTLVSSKFREFFVLVYISVACSCLNFPFRLALARCLSENIG